MGRNAGTKIFWTHMSFGVGDNEWTHYCQQHAIFKQVTGSSYLRTHINDIHGNVEQ